MQMIIGFVIVFGSVVGGYLMATGKLAALWQPAEIIIIIGAAVGAMVISNPSYVLKNIMTRIKMLMGKGYSDDYYKSVLALMFELLETIRKDGIKKLDDHIENPESSDIFKKYPEVAQSNVLVSFITDNLRMMAMGKMNHHDLEAVLEMELHTLEEDLLRPSKAMGKVGEAMPGFGIVAAVLGIVVTMQNIGGPLTLIGVKVAAALVGTFIGVLMAYGVCEPIAAGIAGLVKKEMMALNMTAAILVAQVQGKPTLLALDAGRKVLHSEYKPSFAEMESWVTGD
ncbi:flagellar motor stator protein MotA [Photobacterium jeanii]|uniref:Flagellar motor stator protein MotA n=1 Tax=Photobacterium jeanii TaxID=858640 RepID=A0A178KHM1_9GAMM|nr:flagellar motor stator protein MotA [Photobacterium jeanii]OAN16731.1 flagellar motor stator protein MotA [Photobacterium jeanii]PST87461.1 flagellar motor stator protein MotA [Photobacterium jeanii]